MSGLKSECRKFSPNVFNKVKCQNCFRTKDAHSAEALENNRASRNMSKCGYLFVAPDWDFNVSINRTKRWQRRWFVLYDDGELTYALDEFPDTIPQGTIDMSQVVEVSDAEVATGNSFAISIHTSDRIYFVKGTSREESKWWFDALHRVLPRHMTRTKHKRNATFPCGTATIPTVITQEYCSEDDIRLGLRPKFLSSSDMLMHAADDGDWLVSQDGQEEDVFDDIDASVHIQNALNKLMSETDSSFEGQSNPSDEFIPKDPLSQLEELDSRRRNRRYLKRENRVARSQRSRVEGVSKMLPAKNQRTDRTVSNEATPSPSAMAAAEKLEYLESINPGESLRKTPQSRKEDPSCVQFIEPSSNLHQSKTILRKSESLKNIPSETISDELGDHIVGLRRYHSFKSSCGSSLRKLRPTSSRIKYSSSSLPRTRRLSTDSALSSNLSKSSNTDSAFSSEEHTNEGVFMRTGWLFRQTLSKEWSRHWFVLRDSSFAYYRDPSAENCGIMDGILDLNQVSTIREQDSDRFSAFIIKMWDGKKHILAAETDDFRDMWIHALNYASNLWSSASKEDFICSEIVLPEHNFHNSDRTSDRIASPSSFCSFPIGDEDKLTSSSDDQSEYFSLVDEDEVSELSSSPRTLPPSPPINRNVMSLVKEKSRTRGIPRTANLTTQESEDGKDCETPLPQTDDFCYSANDCHKNNRKSTNHTCLSHQNDMIDVPALKLLPGMGNLERLLKFDQTPPPSNASSPETSLEETFAPDDTKASTPKPKKDCSLCQKIKSKLMAAKEDIRKLKKELKEAHASFDNLEMLSYKLSNDMKHKEDNYSSQIALMTAKIDDLTSKFTLSEKNYRQLKQKSVKSEGKERRRSSLKNKEGFSLTKEYESKLCELEVKIGNIEYTLQSQSSETDDSEKFPLDPTAVYNCRSSSSTDTSETNSLSESAQSEHKGLFSRLQTLGEKVTLVSESLEQSNSTIVSNPKILLQIRENDESFLVEPSDNSLHVPVDASKCENNYPTTLNEFKFMYNQRIFEIFRWMNSSLSTLCNQENRLDTKNSMLLSNLTSVLNTANEVTSPCSEFRNVGYVLSLMSDFTQILSTVENVNSVQTLLGYEVTTFAFRSMVQTLCIAFIDYKISNPLSLLKIFSKFPQIEFFCPVFNNLFSEPSEEQIRFSSVLERLAYIKSEQANTDCAIQEEKKIRYVSLWDTLTDVPVQDNNTRHQRVVNSIFKYITSIAEHVYHIADVQLMQSPSHDYQILKVNNEEVRTWCTKTQLALKDSLTCFMNELKVSCPMVHESTVNLTELSNTTLTEITNLVTELSLLCVCDAILKCIASHSPKFMDVKSYFQLPDKWFQQLQGQSSRSIIPKEFFVCQQCLALRELMSDSTADIDWNEFAGKYVASSIGIGFDFNKESAQSLDSATCDSGYSDSTRKATKDSCNNLTCIQCDGWISKFCESEEQHEIERHSLQKKHNEEIRQIEECLIKSSEVHDQEMLEKENELEAIRSQLHRLKIDHEGQIQSLQNLYDQKLNFDCDSVGENNVRKMYTAEIEDLKAMFKKGLVAIESSHHRIASEMERRHSDQLSLLEEEKERALQLEAEATITALEAIKKSHELQLQQETALIRESLTSKYQNGGNYDLFCNKYGLDLSKMKAEILNITDLYSTKCLENVALEEKVDSLRQQLIDAHNELHNLLTKNAEIDLSLSNG